MESIIIQHDVRVDFTIKIAHIKSGKQDVILLHWQAKELIIKMCESYGIEIKNKKSILEKIKSLFK